MPQKDYPVFSIVGCLRAPACTRCCTRAPPPDHSTLPATALDAPSPPQDLPAWRRWSRCWTFFTDCCQKQKQKLFTRLSIDIGYRCACSSIIELYSLSLCVCVWIVRCAYKKEGGRKRAKTGKRNIKEEENGSMVSLDAPCVAQRGK